MIESSWLGDRKLICRPRQTWSLCLAPANGLSCHMNKSHDSFASSKMQLSVASTRTTTRKVVGQSASSVSRGVGLWVRDISPQSRAVESQAGPWGYQAKAGTGNFCYLFPEKFPNLLLLLFSHFYPSNILMTLFRPTSRAKAGPGVFKSFTPKSKIF